MLCLDMITFNPEYLKKGKYENVGMNSWIGEFYDYHRTYPILKAVYISVLNCLGPLKYSLVRDIFLLKNTFVYLLTNVELCTFVVFWAD